MLPPLGAPGVEREPGLVLVAPGAREPEAREHRQRQDHRPQRERCRREQRGTAGLVRRRGGDGLGLAPLRDPSGRGRSGSVTRAAVASSTGTTRPEAVLTATP